MKIILPMAGAGSRFKTAGYEKPKPLIDVLGKPMIQRVVENLGIGNSYVFILQKEHWYQYASEFEDVFEQTFAHKFILVDGLTEGALSTILTAEHEIMREPDRPLVIANSDQIMAINTLDLYSKFYSSNSDGMICTFKANSPKHSYVTVDENGYVTRVAEKEVISDIATVGVYMWKQASDFVSAGKEIIKRNIRTNNEFYLAPTYNINIERGAKIETFHVDRHYPIGTPEELNNYKFLVAKGDA